MMAMAMAMVMVMVTVTVMHGGDRVIGMWRECGSKRHASLK